MTTKNRTFARITGYSLLLMAVIAGFALGFAFPKIFDLAHLDVSQSNLTENLQLYKSMLIGILLVILLDILVSWTLYKYFKNTNKKLARISSIYRIIYSVIFGIAAYFLVKNLGQKNNEIVIENYNSFQNIWSIGLIIFGFHLLIIGFLMKLHQSIPKILWYLTIVAGASYILVHLLKTAFPESSQLTNTLNNILGLPMALGELGLAIWLLIKGGKGEKTRL